MRSTRPVQLDGSVVVVVVIVLVAIEEDGAEVPEVLDAGDEAASDVASVALVDTAELEDNVLICVLIVVVTAWHTSDGAIPDAPSPLAT